MRIEDLADHIDQPGIDSNPARDIVHLKPDITQSEALQVQLAVKRRRAAAGDRIVGHQASFTSAGIRTLFPDAPRPMVGTILASIVQPSGAEIELDCEEAFIESEMAMILGRDLEGDDLTPHEVMRAIDCFLPSLEVAPLRPGVFDKAYSWPHLIAVQKAFGGFMVFGPRISASRRIDARLEACLVSIDGDERASGAGFEAMGSPVNVIVAMAAQLSEIGEKLHAGQVIMTGSLPPPQKITSANRVATVEFATLGNVSIRIAGN
jgi:2-keto-4-pentenoate hydratase